MSAKTLYDKIWLAHLVREEADGAALLYIDRHLVHEVTSPQAFEGLRLAQRPVWRETSILATADHNTPTRHWERGIAGIADSISRTQIETLDANLRPLKPAAYFPFLDARQGIVHVVGPENGATLPGMTIVCGDSHTSTHGAFGALAFGIGTSEVEHVLATQTLTQRKARNLRVMANGRLPAGCSAKDLALAIIGRIGTAGGTGAALEFAGEAVGLLSMEARMTLCNMAIEAGARAGLVAADETTFAYLKGRALAPKGADWDKALLQWRDCHSDAGAHFDSIVTLDASALEPQITWGTSPEMVVGVSARVPDPEKERDASRRAAMERALVYMGLQPGVAMRDIAPDKIFIGSCTNSRIEDLRIAAGIVRKIGKKLAKNIRQALVVPGSGAVKRQAESEGLHEVFLSAGFEWRQPGCSMCLGMNEDSLAPEERCASTSNRNFEGRQGFKSRTHLLSPAMAAAAALEGRFVDVRGV